MTGAGSASSEKAEQTANIQPVQPYKSESWMCQDPIYGQVELPKLCKVFIDSPEFQRMRHIQQLSSCSRVFPAASHSRFEHSIGVANLTYQTLTGTNHLARKNCET